MGSSSIVDIQDLATGYIPGASDTTLATAEAVNCTVARSAVGVYTATLSPGVVGPIGISPSSTGRVQANSRTKNVNVQITYGADDGPPAPTVIHFQCWNDTAAAAADCNFDFTISRVISET